MTPALPSLALVAFCLFPAHRAHAQSVDPRLFDATPSPGAVVGLESAWVPGHLQHYFGLVVGYANDEVVAKSLADGESFHEPLHTRWVTTLGAGLGLFDRVELQLALPLHAPGGEVADGESSFGLGDMRVGARVALVRPALREAQGMAPGPPRGLGLVLQLGLFLPTGGDVQFSGDGAVVLDPRLVVDWRTSDGLALAAHVGYRARPERTVLDLTIDDELRFGAGVEVPVLALGASVPVALLAEVEGAIGFGEGGPDTTGVATSRKRPIEGRVGARVYGERWELTLAGATGLSRGYGAADLRFIVGFTFSPGHIDGPRPVPSRTMIAKDQGPAPTFAPLPGLEEEVTFAVALKEDPDPDGDGVPKELDKCPTEPEDIDGGVDDDGCPDPDDDGDGVLDAADKCPGELEVPNGIKDDDGCADTGEASVVVQQGGIIELATTIEFNSGSDVLAPSAAPLLEQIAAVLKANAQIKRIRIEGHTDGEGDSEMNVDLSERRAARVRLKLVELGVAPERMLPKGYGATRAVDTNATPEGRKRNRRVELRVIDPPPPGMPRIELEEAP